MFGHPDEVRLERKLETLCPIKNISCCRSLGCGKADLAVQQANKGLRERLYSRYSLYRAVPPTDPAPLK